jgi:hypothetical protein
MIRSVCEECKKEKIGDEYVCPTCSCKNVATTSKKKSNFLKEFILSSLLLLFFLICVHVGAIIFDALVGGS